MVLIHTVEANFFLKPLFRYSIHKAKNLCYMCIFCYCLSLLLAFKYDATFDIQCTMCFVIPTQMLLSHFIHAINLPEKDRSYTRSRHNITWSRTTTTTRNTVGLRTSFSVLFSTTTRFYDIKQTRNCLFLTACSMMRNS